MESTSPTSPVFFQDAIPSIVPGRSAAAEDTLDQLQTAEQVKLLDSIDELRSQGLGHQGISLPQLIVCGDQSSGKSSLLEGLTRLRFPSKAGQTVTTFATEVVLRKASDVQIVCTITPGEARSSVEQRKLAEFKEVFTSREHFNFEEVVQKAKIKMAFDRTEEPEAIIRTDTLKVKYHGPNLPSLTIIDLPGFFEVDESGGNGAQVVDALVERYMKDQSSIIMAVVQAINDSVNQKVFSRLKRLDPNGLRTLGIITKPDRAEKGSGDEEQAIRLVRNEKWPLKYGWHAVKNRGPLTQEHSDEERDESERQFFATEPWAAVSRNDKGVGTLRAKLSHMLLEHIGKELPSLVTTVQDSITTTATRLKALGIARETSIQQRTYLTGHAENFQMLTRDALRGTYSDRFFETRESKRTATRLRTEIQNLNISFAIVMDSRGHTWEIVDDVPSRSSTTRTGSILPPTAGDYDCFFVEPERISRREFLENNIGDCVRQSRPAGLPSLVNPSVIGEVFRQQSQPWKEIAQRHIKCVFDAVTQYVNQALASLMDTRTCNMLLLKHIRPELEARRLSLEAKLDELLMPYTESEPITYDTTFLRELEEMRAARYHPVSGLEGTARGASQADAIRYNKSTQQLLANFGDDYTNSEILNLVQSYYKRALTVFISNVTSLGIENCLLKNLHAVFSPSLVACMSEEKLEWIASDSKETRDKRVELKLRLDILESGKQILYEHIASQPDPIVSQPSPRAPKNKTRPRTPVPEPSIEPQVDEPATTVEPFSMFSVTPPRSVSKPSPSRSRSRVDSVTSTPFPTPQRGQRKRSPLSRINGFGARVEDADDDEEL